MREVKKNLKQVVFQNPYRISIFSCSVRVFYENSIPEKDCEFWINRDG